MKKGFKHICSLTGNLQLRFAAGCLSVALIATTAPAFAEAAESGVSAQQAAPADNHTVKGTVVDENGEPLIGATVYVKGTTTGTTTDLDGKFTIQVPAGSSISVSYVGYTPQTVKPTPGSDLTITLKSSSNTLDEVVAIGYGTMKKRDLTGAISSVKSDVVKLTPTSNPMEALQGRIAGLDITRSSGQAGEGVEMLLRGNRSFSASGTPLFIIDGMPGDYQTLNPNDIESIEVLKDASSTAIYGSAGANGVIIITTKKGEKGKVSINFDAYYGYNGWAKLPKMNSAREWVYTRLLAQQEGGTIIDDIEGQTAQGALERGATIDWADAVLRDGQTQNYSVSVSGGTENTQIYFSLNYSDENGQYVNDDYKLYSSTLRASQKINKWLTAGMHMQASHVNQEKAYSKLDNVLRANPFGSLYNEDGSIKIFPIDDDGNQLNLLLNNDKNVYRDHPTRTKVYVQPYIRINPFKGLTFESRLSANYNYSKNQKFIGYGSYQFYNEAGKLAVGDEKNPAYAKYVSASIKNSDSQSYQWENILTYNFSINNEHDFTITGVTTWSDSHSESSTADNVGFSSNTYYWTNLGVSGQTNSSVASDYSMGSSFGLVGRLNYSYLGRYLFSASVRHDGNSRLAKGRKWSTFPAVSAGWRISDESFMESTAEWLNNLKLRVGYGETGAAGIQPYSSYTLLQQGVMGLGNEQILSYYYPEKLSNPALTWERSKNTNIGLDVSLFNNRVDLSMEYYITNTDDVIWTQSLPVTNGGFNATTPFKMDANIAKTRNKGFEMTLTTQNIVTRNFNWNSTITFSKNNEKVTSLGEGASEYISNGNYTLKVGYPVKSFYNYKIAGVWQYGEEADAAVFGKRPGDLKVYIPNMSKVSDGVYEKSYPKELDDNGNPLTRRFDAENPYTPGDNDRVMLGHNTPDWSLGFQNRFTYKAFDLSTYMYWRHGQMISYDPMLWYTSGGGAFPSHFNYWTSTNPSNDFPALDNTRDWKQDAWYSAKKFQDGSFFKIKNITLGFNLPASACSRVGIRSLRLYTTITNPLVHANNPLLKNYDPEMNGKLDFPLTKQLVVGLNLSI